MESETLAREAQRILAGLAAPALASICAHVYRGQPDFEELSAIERSHVPGQPPPSPPAGSWLSFVYSKPSIEAGSVNVHVLECVNGPPRFAGMHYLKVMSFAWAEREAARG